MNKNQRDEQRHQEDLALSRGLIWVGAAIVLELLLLLVNKYYVNFYSTQASVNLAIALQTGLKAVRIISLVGMAACAVWAWLNMKKNGKATVPVVMLLGCAALCFCSHITLAYNDSGVRMLFLLVPAWAALALVYYLYQREFFISGVFTGLGVVVLWLIRHGATSVVTMYLFLALMVVVIGGGLLWLNMLRKADGKMKLGGKSVEILPQDANYAIMFAVALVNVAAAVLGLLMGSTIAYYLVYVLVAGLFGLLVYYTVKMM